MFLFTRLITLQEDKDLIKIQNQQELNELQAQVKQFNQKITLLSKARNEVFPWSNFFLKIKTIAAQQNVEILRIAIESDQKSISLNARATDEKKAADFKQSLMNEPQFKDVIMPLAGIQSGIGNLIDFYITFKID